MIRIYLNGESKVLHESLTLDKLVTLLKIEYKNIAIAHNYDVIPKSELCKTQIKDGDQIDIIQPVGGG